MSTENNVDDLFPIANAQLHQERRPEYLSKEKERPGDTRDLFFLSLSLSLDDSDSSNLIVDLTLSQSFIRD